MRICALVLFLLCGTAMAYYGTMPVASKLPNAYGLYDMAGNVWEWCNNLHTRAYLSIWNWNNPGDTIDPKGPDSLAYVDARVARGGSFQDNPFALRSAQRNPMSPGIRYFHYGFRCVLPAAAPSVARAGMKAIPAGTFIMGSLRGSDEQPQYRAHMSAFYMDSTEMTQASYQAITGQNPSHCHARW